MAYLTIYLEKTKPPLQFRPEYGCFAYGDMVSGCSFYNHEAINKQTPIFLVTGKEDTHMPFKPYQRFRKLLIKNNCKVDSCFIENAGHGFGINSVKPENNIWLDQFIEWLEKL